MVFTEQESFLIDFDLARPKGNLYPMGFQPHEVYSERHEGAKGGHLMKTLHDRHSISYIIMKSVGGSGKIVDTNIPLGEIIEDLKSSVY